MALKSLINSMVPMVGNLSTFLTSRAVVLWNAFDRRDLFFFGGLIMLWYGLNIIHPAIAYSVCGGVFTVVGLVGSLLGGKK